MAQPKRNGMGLEQRLERLAFLFSLAFLAFFYGWGAGALGWSPGPAIRDAVVRVESHLRPTYFNPRVHDRHGAEIRDPARIQPGLTLVTAMWPDGEGWIPGLRLMDVSGRILHSWQADPSEIFAGFRPRGRPLDQTYIHGAHLYPDGEVVFNIETVGTARLDACGAVLWRFLDRSHHSLALDDDGGIWVPALDYLDSAAQLDRAGPFPGLTPPIFDSRLVKLSEKGKVLQEVSMLEILYRNGLERYVARAMGHAPDVLHMNDIEPLSAAMASEYPLFEAGDLVVSLRNANLVLVVDPDAKEVKWHASDPFVQQHDPDFIGDGWIGVFDNARDGTARGELLGGTRIVGLQPHTDSVRVLFAPARSEPFYTEQMGKWQLLPNGNGLLTEAQAGRVLELTPDGRPVWEWIHEPADEDRVAEVSEASRVPYTVEQVAAWPCSSATGVTGEEG